MLDSMTLKAKVRVEDASRELMHDDQGAWWWRWRKMQHEKNRDNSGIRRP